MATHTHTVLTAVTPIVHRSISSVLDNSQAFRCQTTYATAFLLLRAAWHYLLWDPVAGTDSQPLLLVAQRTWSLMSLRQLTDAVTAPRYNTTHWQTHCDKDMQAHQRVHRHTYAQSHKCPCLVDALDDSSWDYNLYSVFIFSSGFHHPDKVSCTYDNSHKEILEFKCFFVTLWLILFFHMLNTSHLTHFNKLQCLKAACGFSLAKFEIYQIWHLNHACRQKTVWW